MRTGSGIKTLVTIPKAMPKAVSFCDCKQLSSHQCVGLGVHVVLLLELKCRCLVALVGSSRHSHCPRQGAPGFSPWQLVKTTSAL